MYIIHFCYLKSKQMLLDVYEWNIMSFEFKISWYCIQNYSWYPNNSFCLCFVVTVVRVQNYSKIYFYIVVYVFSIVMYFVLCFDFGLLLGLKNCNTCPRPLLLQFCGSVNPDKTIQWVRCALWWIYLCNYLEWCFISKFTKYKYM